MDKINRYLGRFATKGAKYREDKAQTQSQKLVYKKLRGLRKASEDCLLAVRTVFPFTLFPDTIRIDRTKVSIATKSFVSTEKVVSISCDDLLNVELDHGPVFGTIKLFSRFFEKQPLQIRFLLLADARKVERLLQGIIIAKQAGIDVANIPKGELIKELRRIGHNE